MLTTWKLGENQSFQHFFCFCSAKNFWISRERLSWEEAKESCTKHRGNLISIRNKLEMLHVEKLIGDKKEEFWIGYKRNSRNSGFYWTEKNVNVFISVQNRRNDGNCVQMTGLSKFNNEHCDERRRYICTLSGI